MKVYAQKVNYVGVDISKSLVKQVYDYYQQQYEARVNITLLSKIDEVVGVYDFELSYTRDIPPNIFIIYNNKLFCISNEGYSNPKGVIAEMSNILSYIHTDAHVYNCIYKGVLEYLVNLYGAFQSHLIYNRRPIFHGIKDKVDYIKSKVHDIQLLGNYAAKIKRNPQEINRLPFFILKENFNNEELIMLLALLGDNMTFIDK
uniref:Uncharacterized protein n=1 Tax=Prevotella sp. GTC17260 TaxID=3236796 RepID=A0AB33JCW2_9BACT